MLYVICYLLIVNIIAFFLTTDRDLASVILIHISYTIINGIFKNRLNDQLYCAILINLFININFALKTLLVSNFLNIHITSAMLDLIRYSDHRSAL